MTDLPLSLILLMIVTAVVLVRGLMQEAGYLQYPFLAAAVMAGWFIPQAMGLAEDQTLPEGGYTITMIYAAASMVAIMFGERWGGKVAAGETWVYNETRLAIGATVLSAIGAVAFSLLMHSSVETNAEGLTTGIATIYFFLYALQYIGLALALLLLLKKFSWFTFAIVAFNYSSISGFILFGGRRGAAADVAFITLCALWFQRRILPPRALMLVGIVFGALMVNVAGEYRSLVTTINQNAAPGQQRLPTLQEVMEIPFFERFEKTATKGSFEVRNAVYYISAALESGSYDLGLHYWNFFVFRYIPGQIVGPEMKQALMFDLQDNPLSVYDYRPHLGTTYTGFTDTFSSFSFFGVFVFAGISALMNRWWRSALAGNFEIKLIYVSTVATAMHSITHGADWFFCFLPQVFIFTFPIFYWARQRKSEEYMPAPRVQRLRLNSVR